MVGMDDEQKRRAQQERAALVSRGRTVLKELVVHLLFLWIVVSLSYGTNDTNSYYVYKTISDTYFGNFVDKVDVATLDCIDRI